MDVAVAIPTYDEHNTIFPIVRGLGDLFDAIYVIDDSLNAGTRIAAGQAGARVIRGPGCGLAAAYLYAIRSIDAEYIITMDAGFTHPAYFVKKLATWRRAADIVVIQRKMGCTSYRSLLTSAAGMTIGTIKDATCGARSYRRDAILPILDRVKSKGHVFQAEILYHALSGGLSVAGLNLGMPYLLEMSSRVRGWEIRESAYFLWRVLWKRLWNGGDREGTCITLP